MTSAPLEQTKDILYILCAICAFFSAAFGAGTAIAVIKIKMGAMKDSIKTLNSHVFTERDGLNFTTPNTCRENRSECRDQIRNEVCLKFKNIEDSVDGLKNIVAGYKDSVDHLIESLVNSQ